MLPPSLLGIINHPALPSPAIKNSQTPFDACGNFHYRLSFLWVNSPYRRSFPVPSAPPPINLKITT